MRTRGGQFMLRSKRKPRRPRRLRRTVRRRHLRPPQPPLRRWANRSELLASLPTAMCPREYLPGAKKTLRRAAATSPRPSTGQPCHRRRPPRITFGSQPRGAVAPPQPLPTSRLQHQRLRSHLRSRCRLLQRPNPPEEARRLRRRRELRPTSRLPRTYSPRHRQLPSRHRSSTLRPGSPRRRPSLRPRQSLPPQGHGRGHHRPRHTLRRAAAHRRDRCRALISLGRTGKVETARVLARGLSRWLSGRYRRLPRHSLPVARRSRYGLHSLRSGQGPFRKRRPHRR